MNDKQRENIDAIDRADQALVVNSAISNYVHNSVNAAVSGMVAHYRGSQLTHDYLIGKVAEISALMSMLDTIHGDIRSGDAARDREYGDGTKAQRQPASPGSSSRPKSS